MSPEEAVDEWRAEHAAETEPADAVAALREALADLDAGNVGVTLEQFDRKFRERHASK